jgi:hypothetical protein
MTILRPLSFCFVPASAVGPGVRKIVPSSFAITHPSDDNTMCASLDSSHDARPHRAEQMQPSEFGVTTYMKEARRTTRNWRSRTRMTLAG